LIDNNTEYCPFCGSLIEKDSQFCHNCGAHIEQQKQQTNDSTPSVRIISERPIAEFPNLDTTPLAKQFPIGNPGFNQGHSKSTQTTTYPDQRQIKQNHGLGVMSFILGILAFIGILPLFGSLLAITFGGYKSGPLGILGRILGFISLVFYIAMILVMFI
jgi:hypothetical protein